MDEKEIKELNRFWFILGFVQAKVTESSDLFDRNWLKFASVFEEKVESDNKEEITDAGEEPVPEKIEDEE